MNKTKTNTRPARRPTNYALVVGDDDGGRLLGHVAPVLPHGDAHVRALPVCLFCWLIFGGSSLCWRSSLGRRERCVTDTIPTCIRIQTETYRHTQRHARTDTYTSTDTYTGTQGDRQTGTYTQRHAERGRHAQRRRVVDPVPGHGHHAAAAVQRLDQRHLRRKREGTACR